MNRLIIAAAALLSAQVSAYNLDIAEPKAVSVEAYKYEGVHDPYLYPVDQDISYGASFNTDFYLLHSRDLGLGLYWDNQLHFDQSRRDGKVKHAGWQYEVGISALETRGNPRVEIFRQHWSRHIMEETRPFHFPVYDRYGFRINLLP